MREFELYEPEASEMRIKLFRAFQEAFAPRAELIYYPGCELDTSPSEAFSESHVIYADISLEATISLREHGFTAWSFDANTFVPVEQTDIVIILNSGVKPEFATTNLRTGGYLLCNNYSGTTKEAIRSTHLTHVGSLELENGQPILCTENLQEYWQEIDTEEAFVTHRASASYCRDVRKFTGKNEDFLAEYRTLLERSRKATAEFYAALERAHPDPFPLRLTDSDGPIYVDPRDPSTVLSGIPKKRGHADTLFVFRRKLVME